MQATPQPTLNRRHDIDWVRTLAFLLLIFYHIGMYYVADWGWHVKSEHQSELLQTLMLLINPWRMPLIFIISGMALAAVERKFNARSLITMRTTRLLLPAIVCSYLIVWPQAYFEAVQYHGYTGTATNFFLNYLTPGTELLPEMHHSPLGLFTWNHLWYLFYLWTYTLVFIALKQTITLLETPVQWLVKRPYLGLPVVVGWLVLIELTLPPHFPKTNALVDDWYNHARYFSLLILGYYLFRSQAFFQKVADARNWFLISAIGLSVFALVIKSDAWFWQWGRATPLVILVSAALMCIFAIFAYAHRHLNQPSPVLRYMNQAILPWYIVHQTITIVIASLIKPIAFGPILEATIVIIGTLLGCFLSYELIKRVRVLRAMFGLKNEKRTRDF
ncbi:acyltransferase family protein [Arenicella chitinivorans]|nr:acyltransferase family protein [Arenicella chitinivorans]